MSMEKAYDAIVVGAGPAGSSFAILLARKGWRVLLLEKASYPRDKVCGDAHSGKTIAVYREIGILEELKNYEYSKVKNLKMIAPNDSIVKVPFPNAKDMDCAGYVIRRFDADNVLFNQALKEDNIEVKQNFQVEGVINDENGNAIGVKGKDLKTNNPEKFFGRVIVGADGSSSVVANSLGLPPVPKEHTYIAVRGYWEGIKDLDDSIELYFTEMVLPGYLWVFPLGRDKANIGLGILNSDVQKRKVNPIKLLEEVLSNHKVLKEKMSDARKIGEIKGWSIPNGSYTRKSYGKSWILIGDAACLVDPFSGEGIGNAVTSAKFASEVLDRCLRKEYEKIPESELAEYEMMLRKYMRHELETSYMIQRLSRHKFLLNMFLSKAKKKPEFRQLLIDMLANDETKKTVKSPLFYLKLLLP